jgi:hypothetical protein
MRTAAAAPRLGFPAAAARFRIIARMVRPSPADVKQILRRKTIFFIFLPSFSKNRDKKPRTRPPAP